MRKRFEQQFTLGTLLIEHTKIPTSKRSGALPGLCAALKEIYMTPEYNNKVFCILEDKILPKNNNTGRPGLNLFFMILQIKDSECRLQFAFLPSGARILNWVVALTNSLLSFFNLALSYFQ